MSRNNNRKYELPERRMIFHTGNLRVYEWACDGLSHLDIADASDSWVATFDETDAKYMWLQALIADKTLHPALEIWLILMFHVLHANPDPTFLDHLYKALEGLRGRTVEYAMEHEDTAEGHAYLDREMRLLNDDVTYAPI